MTKFFTLIAAVLAAAACQQQAGRNEQGAQDNGSVVSDISEARRPTPPVDSVPNAPPPPSQPVPRPSPSPPPATAPSVPDSEKTPAAAKTVVEAYFKALAERRYAAAYRLYPASGMSAAEFAASYAKYRTFNASVGTPGDTEGGAGSIYIEIPVVVTGTLRTGGPFRLEGPVSLRRVNDVDGATEAQLRWHIFATGLKPRP